MKSKYIVIVLASVALLAAGCSNKTASPAPTAEQKMEKTEMMKDKKMMSDEEMHKMSDEGVSASGGKNSGMMKDEAMKKQGSYKDYSPETMTLEQKAGQKVVLYFHAPWCPFCKAADADFKTHTDKIPAGVTVLKTDYDSNGELKKKYGVTYQHTFVQIDASGNEVTKWISGDTELLAKNIK